MARTSSFSTEDPRNFTVSAPRHATPRMRRWRAPLANGEGARSGRWSMDGRHATTRARAQRESDSEPEGPGRRIAQHWTESL